MLSVRLRLLLSSTSKRFSSFSVSPRLRAGLLSAGAAGMLMMSGTYAHCEPSSESESGIPNHDSQPEGSSDGADPFDPIKSLVNKYYEYTVNQLGISGCVGVCCGVAFKRIGRGIAFVIGITFTGLQALSYLGYVKIDYNKVARDANKVLDVNGDGKLDAKDVHDLVFKGKSVLGSQLPSFGGFCSGFAIGLYFG